jgi:hypothetical protein
MTPRDAVAEIAPATTATIPNGSSSRDPAVLRLADMLHRIERAAAELRNLGGSVTFGVVFCVTVRNGSESKNYSSTDLNDALAEAAFDIAALRARGRLPTEAGQCRTCQWQLSKISKGARRRGQCPMNLPQCQREKKC